MLTEAWWNAVLQKTDPKKFPKRPEQVWDKKAPDQSLESMVALAMMYPMAKPKDPKKVN